MATPPPASSAATVAAPPPTVSTAQNTALGILFSIAFCHGLNDLMQSVVPAVYPILKDAYALDYGQIGLITFCNTVTASMLQPIIGLFTDKRPKPYSLAIGMGFTLAGLLSLSVAPSYAFVLM